MQEKLCTSKEIECVNKMKVDTSACLKPCRGLIVTSFSKTEEKKIFEDLSIFGAYKRYKKITPYPSGYPGKYIYYIIACFWIIQKCLDYEWKHNLRYVRIYFETSTFDRITKDRAAKFVDMLSAIGGTMGLLTGFSIISAVEILYFVSKLVLKLSLRKS